MKNIKYLVVLVCMTFVSISLFAQEKYLETESDGFQWYRLIQGNKCGAQSIKGITLIPLSRGYENVWYRTSIGDKKEGWFEVEMKGKSGACDLNGREIVASKYDQIDLYYKVGIGYYYQVYLDEEKGFGVCNDKGYEIVSPGKYDYVFYHDDFYKQGYLCVVLEDGNGNSFFGACDLNGNEIIYPKYKTLKCSDGVFKYKNASDNWVSIDVKLEKSSSSSNASGNSSKSSSSSSPTSQPQPQPVRPLQPMQVWQSCGMCQGTGQCQTCLGTGHTLVYPCQDRCWNCGGSGKCTHCAGHGGQNIIVYQ